MGRLLMLKKILSIIGLVLLCFNPLGTILVLSFLVFKIPPITTKEEKEKPLP